MSAPKEIHRFLLEEGFRHVGRGGYWKFMKNKPIAWLVRVHDIEIRDEKFIYIFLNLAYPDDGILNDVDALVEIIEDSKINYIRGNLSIHLMKVK